VNYWLDDTTFPTTCPGHHMSTVTWVAHWYGNYGPPTHFSSLAETRKHFRKIFCSILNARSITDITRAVPPVKSITGLSPNTSGGDGVVHPELETAETAS